MRLGGKCWSPKTAKQGDRETGGAKQGGPTVLQFKAWFYTAPATWIFKGPLLLFKGGGRRHHLCFYCAVGTSKE